MLYFEFEGREMVLIVREWKDFDRCRKAGHSLQQYCDSPVSDSAYGAVLALKEMIPKVSLARLSLVRRQSTHDR